MALSVIAAGNLWSLPCPSADIAISGLSGDVTNTLSVWRSVAGARTELRGGARGVLGVATILSDWECPFATDVTYQVTEYKASGAVVGTAQSLPFQMDPGKVWISDPLNPSASCVVPALDAVAIGSLTYSRPGAIVSIIGSDTPVLSAGIRSVATGIPLDMLAFTVGQRLSLLSVLQFADPVLVRVPAGDKYSNLPPLAYCSADSIVVVPWANQSGATLQLSVTLVKPPTANIVVPSRTYGDLPAEASSYGDLLALYSNYLSVIRGA